jgi:uncharacterized protein YdaU (DUF1376 family)
LEKAMHYYQFNIGDYISHTRHLTLAEDAIYRRLLDAYYLQEHPLNGSVAAVARQINARDYEMEVCDILTEFFDLTEKGWINVRADKEIEKYHAKSEQASKAGKASAKARSNKPSTDVEHQLNENLTDEQPNIKQETINKKQEQTIELPDWLSETHWKDFVEFRKFIKKPMTEKAKHLMLSKLQKIKDNGHDPILAMNTSIANNWSDIYEPKPNTLNVINKQGFDGRLRGAK